MDNKYINYYYKFSDNATDAGMSNSLVNLTEDDVKQMYMTKTQYSDMLHKGYIKLYGWLYVYNLNCYVVKDKYGNLGEYYAPNKTCLRAVLGSHTIDYIVQVKK